MRRVPQDGRFAPECAAEIRKEVVATSPETGGLAANGNGPSDHRVLLRLTLLIEHSSRSSSVDAQLDADEPLEREFAAELLGPHDRDSLSRLIALLEDSGSPRQILTQRRVVAALYGFENRLAHDAAAKAISRILPEHPQAVPGLVLMVQSADDPRDRVKAAMDLGRHGNGAAEHVDVLVKALDSNDDRLVAEAATALGMIGVKTGTILDRLRTLTTDPRPAIAKRAEVALRSLEKR